MYTTSNEYKISNLQPHRQFESNITIGSRTLTNEEVISFSIEQSIQQDDTFSIGNTISSCLNLVFLHNDIDTSDKDVVNPKLGLLVNGLYEYIPLGVYNISSIDTNDTTTNLICYDNMIKFDIAYTENSQNPTLYTVINRLTELTGVQFGGTLTDYTNYSLSVLENYSCREILGFIAGVLGANAIINREGKFDFVSIVGKNSQLSIDYDRYYDYTKKNKNYILKRIVNITNLEEISVGTIDETSSTLELQNPYINESILQDLYIKLNNLEFLPYSLNWNGDISLDLGDLVSITDKKEVTRIHPILSQTITYTGALNSVLVAQGETKTLNETNSTTNEENEIIRVGKKVVQVQKDAGELYVVVYDEENESSVRLTEKMLEAIADTIQLTANNIQLEGLVTANNFFKINLDGSIEAVNGKFTGIITGSTIQSTKAVTGGTNKVNIEGAAISSCIEIDESTKSYVDIEGDTITLGQSYATGMNKGSKTEIRHDKITIYDWEGYEPAIVLKGDASIDGSNTGYFNGNVEVTGKLNVAGGVRATGTYTGKTAYNLVPMGLSSVQGNASEGFPTDYSTLLTVKQSDYRQFQIASRNTGLLYYRAGHSDNTGGTGTGWGPWYEVYTSRNWEESKATNGYCKFQNGIIIQWGYQIVNPSAANTVTTQAITFPVTFPSACRGVQITPRTSVPNIVTSGATDIGTTGFAIAMTRTNTTATSYSWFAIGY